jgi:hypothetical protein
MTMYQHRFTVAGTYPFPLDMLRYDACYPAHEPETAVMADTMNEHYRGDSPVEITLVHLSTNKHWKPTAARWLSFQWHVLYHEVNRLVA